MIGIITDLLKPSTSHRRKHCLYTCLNGYSYSFSCPTLETEMTTRLIFSCPIPGSNQRLLQRPSHHPRRGAPPVSSHPLPGRIPLSEPKQRTGRCHVRRTPSRRQRCSPPQRGARLEGGLLRPAPAFQDVPRHLRPIQHLHQGGAEPTGASQSGSSITWRLPGRLRHAGQHDPTGVRQLRIPFPVSQLPHGLCATNRGRASL